MKIAAAFLLSIGLVGSLCGCLTTIPEGSRHNYLTRNIPRDRTGKPIPLLTQDVVRERWLGTGMPY